MVGEECYEKSTFQLNRPSYPKLAVNHYKPLGDVALPTFVICQVENPLYGLYVVIPVDFMALTIVHLIL